MGVYIYIYRERERENIVIDILSLRITYLSICLSVYLLISRACIQVQTVFWISIN